MIPSEATPKDLNAIGNQTLISHLGIEFTAVGSDFVEAKMPVDERTFQPMGMLHGGASVALAETLGSAASYLMVDINTHYPVCIEINANHVGGAKEGFVHGTAKLVHEGKSTHVWSIEIVGDDQKLISTSRMTMMIIKRK